MWRSLDREVRRFARRGPRSGAVACKAGIREESDDMLTQIPANRGLSGTISHTGQQNGKRLWMNIELALVDRDDLACLP